MIWLLDERIGFPDPHTGEPSGLVAVGGDLSEERLLVAYSNGFFPWTAFREQDEYGLHWYCPLERFVIFPDEIHISHSMRSLMRKRNFTATFDRAFDRVIERCSLVDGRYDHPGAWLGADIIKAYTHLHEIGVAHSVEVWDEEHELVGGLYGVTMGHGFMGESMFSDEPSGSKLALIALAKIAKTLDIAIIDCQYETPHLRSMGGRTIDYETYMSYLKTGKAEENKD